MTAEPQLPELSESAFYMLRCVVAVAAADKMIRSQELLFLNNLLGHYRKKANITPAQVARLQDDLKALQPVDALLEHVTDPSDRAQLVLFAGLMAQADGEVHPSEEELVRKIHAACTRRVSGDTAAPAVVEEPAEHVEHVEPEPVQVPVPTAAPGGVQAIPGFDVAEFKKEIRSMVQQEFYKHALSTSGVGPKTGVVAVTDAFTERNDGRTRKASFEMIAGDAGRHRAVYEPGEEEEVTLPKTDFGLRDFLKLIIPSIILWLISLRVDVVTAAAAHWLLGTLEYWPIPDEDRVELTAILSSPLWGTLPSRFFRNWAGLLVLWKLYAMWMSGRLSNLMRRSLVPGEMILGKARFHFIYICHPLLLAGLLWLLSFKANAYLTGRALGFLQHMALENEVAHEPFRTLFVLLADPFWGTLPGMAMRALGWFVVLLRIVRAWMTEIVVTDSRLLFRQGVLKIRTLKIDISNLRQVDVHQSLLGHALGFGDVHIYTNNVSGKGDDLEVAGITLPPVADPHTFSTLIDRARRMWRKGRV